MQSLKWLGSETRHWQARKQVYLAICCDGLDRPLRGKRFDALTVRCGPFVLFRRHRVLHHQKRPSLALPTAVLHNC